MNWYKVVQLHGVILLGSLIPIIALYISLPAIEIILIRTLMAVVILGVGLRVVGYRLKLPLTVTKRLLASGILTSLYWTLLFISAKLSNASVSLVGIASASIWTSFILPILNRKKLDVIQMGLGILAMLGIMLIKNKDFAYDHGLLVALAAGFFGALLTVLNSNYVQRNNCYVITFYQMIGAFLSTIVLVPVYRFIGVSRPELSFHLSVADFFWILALAIVFSIFLYAQLIRLVKTLSPFTVTLAANMTPIYGILLALLLKGESEVMSISFYFGIFLIVISVVIYPVIDHFITPNTKTELSKKEKDLSEQRR